MEVLSYSTEAVAEWGHDVSLNPVILGLCSPWCPHAPEVSVTLHFYLCSALPGSYGSSGQSKNPIAVMLSSLWVFHCLHFWQQFCLTTVLPRFIYSCGDAAQCKIGQCFGTLGQMCILSLGRWCCVQQGCAQELLRSCGWKLADPILSICPSCSFPRQVCCAAGCSCCTHTLFHIWKCLSWRSEKPLMPLALQGCKLVPSCRSTSLLSTCTRLGSIFLSLTVCMCCWATVAS